MSFKFPDSSPPSTPDKPQSPFSNISTTPAGPPPSSSTFRDSRAGSRSNVNFSESAFSQSGNFGGNESLFSSISSSGAPSFLDSKSSVMSGSFGNFGQQAGGFRVVNGGNNLKVRNRKPHGLSQMTTASDDWEDEEDVGEGEEQEDAETEEDDDDYDDKDEDEYEDEGEDEEDEHEDDDEQDKDEDSERDMQMDATTDLSGMKKGFTDPIFTGFGQSTAPGQKRIYSNPNNAKRAKIDEEWAISSPQASKDTIGPRKTQSQFPSVARDLTSRAKAPAVTEPGEVVIQTDYYIGALLDKLQQNEEDDAEALVILSEATAALTDFWGAACEQKRKQTGQYRPHDNFGPGDNASGLENATVVASLLLQLHHPRVKGSDRRNFKSSSNGQSLALVASIPKSYTPIPKVLTDWLNANHLGSLHEIEALQQTSPNPTASPHFWAIIQAGVLRGRFGEVAALLRSADFNYAHSALEDGFSQPGYRGMQLQTVQKSVNKAIQMLEASPINLDSEWDILGLDWTAYRKRIQSAQIELHELAEGDKPPQQAGGTRFEAAQFGAPTPSFARSQSGFSFAQSSRMAESRVPWSIYQGISDIYGVILGRPSAIMSVAQDWIEATVGLTAWWNGQEVSNIAVFGNRDEPTEIDRQDAYIRRLNDCFGEVTDGAQMKSRPNPLNKLDVAVACVFEGNVVGAVKLLKTWSLCIASAVAEIAHGGGWLEVSTSNIPGFLNQDDLMVLSYGQNGNASLDQISKDDVLDAYAEALGCRDQFEYDGTVRKGWEMALEVLSRMEDNKNTRKKVSRLLEKIPVDTVAQVDQVITLCVDLGFEDEGRKIAANFGEKIIAEGQTRADCDYGLAMICFARARSVRKVKEIANNLIAYSLQQSRAWPPEEQLGGQLRALVQNPKMCLASIASADNEAAQIIQFYASGYATLRRFYDHRDEPVLAKGRKSHLRPLARKRAAAQALLAVIRSSADSIYGGLYDPERDSAVLVDNLMALLGEAVLFVNEKPSILSIEQQSNILAAIEDLETVTPRVYAAAKEFFYECLNEYIYETTGEPRKSSSSPTPTGLKKSASGLTASSSFSMIDSHMADSSMTHATNNTIASSGVLVPKPDAAYEYAKPIERVWDWRSGLAESSAASGGASENEDGDSIKPDKKLLRVLRLRLAQEMTWR
ncbi:nuclear pore complex subunit Nup85, putative [Talaromyces stipitatus ATCC 10500]|uniref:Nuclear pore complex protein Nup85 n=1 Tax=Talaromyces stipitatus (strain ATCC 10500 / CBS 375.48 / QM 6759 / NRRL 1006) TaxID=441959 RepID=B8MU23_TALSN|nr:nuclear pore complex subunit Nup85, putative [Talaromyces stipitatus ATCC 10500]EED12656.1 nuclear pore complex subunit Nup85, putative [Talaromyces stipitatus ATCC 10500]